MYTFLVLGLIPGTNIQIGFWTWLVIAGLLAVVLKRYRSRLVLAVAMWWHQFDEDEAASRKPLHASRLHLRGL